VEKKLSDSYFKNKKILLISPLFYSYHIGIVNGLVKKGAEVEFIPEVNNSFFYRLSKKISGKLKCFLERKHKNEILKLCELSSFDLILVIRGELFDVDFVEVIKEKQPRADLFLYQWDSYLHSDYREIISSFKMTSTFDYTDSKVFGIPYIPLFFLPEYNNTSSEIENEYALSFFGAYHSDRLKLVKFFTKELNKIGLKHRLHLYIPFFSFVYRVFVGEIKLKDIKYFFFNKASSLEVNKTYRQSVAVLDVELMIQSGLSIRTFEVLSSGSKLITTNENIKNEDFYDSKFISCLNRKELKFDPNFFLSKHSGVDIESYSLSNWLDKVFFTNV